MSPWETVGYCRRRGDGIDVTVGSVRFAVAKEDAPALIVEGADCDVWDVANPSRPVGRAGWSAEGRMLVLSIPGIGVVQVPGAQICSHYLKEDTRPVRVVMPPERAALAVPA
jgi:hypothetical protein